MDRLASPAEKGARGLNKITHLTGLLKGTFPDNIQPYGQAVGESASAHMKNKQTYALNSLTNKGLA